MNKWLVRSFIAAMAVAASSACLAAPAARALTLKIGDPAPAYNVTTWLKGAPVPRLEKGQIYLVEFWATRCAPCIAALPHLKELSERYKGKVTFIAIGQPYDWETVEDVKKFVIKKDALMPYAVALDTLSGKGKRTYDSWGPPAGFAGLPVTFIVDGAGKVAWTGLPMQVDKPLEQIVAGTYDMKAARRQQETDHIAALADSGRREWFQTALANKEYADVIQRVDNLAARDMKLEAELFPFKLMALLQTDPNEAVVYAHILPPELQGTAAEVLAGQEGLPKSAYQFVAEQLEKQVSADPDAHVVTWQMLAKTQHRLGNLDRAIAALQTALKKSQAMGYDEFTTQLNASLKEYQAEKARRGK